MKINKKFEYRRIRLDLFFLIKATSDFKVYMNSREKQKIRKLFGSFLKTRRENVLGIKSVRQLSFSSNLDYSKLNKIEKGLVDLRFDTLIELAITYKLPLKELLNFEIDFWKDFDE